jgi:hypothetical protein
MGSLDEGSNGGTFYCIAAWGMRQPGLNPVCISSVKDCSFAITAEAGESLQYKLSTG